MNTIQISDKQFVPFISANDIQKSIRDVAHRINRDLTNTTDEIVFVCILNGSFMFAADLLKHITLPCTISFVRVSSYEGTASTGKVTELLGLQDDIENKTVVIIEDIVDSGLTLESIVKNLAAKKPAELLTTAMFFKPMALKTKITVNYVGIEIPNDFVVGYGLDYNNYGRNYPDLYRIAR